MNRPRVLAVIPARGGSKGLPGKNIRPFLGLPLIAHTILFAKMCPEITRAVVSTDAEEIASTAKRYGADVPFLRPANLAQDATPMWPVLRHALMTLEMSDDAYDEVLLLDPTSPAREPADVAGMLQRLRGETKADGVLSASCPTFNPLWHCVVEKDGWMTDLIPGACDYTSRQQVPTVLRINGALYVWQAAFMRRQADRWRREGRHLLYEIPELRAMSIDTPEEFAAAEALVKGGIVAFPWMHEVRVCAG